VSRSVLLVALHAPPSPLVGARRPAALAKELGRRGHHVAILTSLASGRGPVEAGAVTIRSRDLLSTRLNWRRASFEAMQGARPGRYREASPLQSVVVPDLSIVSWLPFLLPRALRAAREFATDCVITTGPPQSAHLVGLALRRRGVPWIADLRDGWTFDPPRPPWPSPALTRLDTWLESTALRASDRVVCVTEPIARDLRDRLGIDAVTITNGFDPEEAPAADGAGLLSPERFSLVHTGRLIASGDSARTLLEGALELRRRRPASSRPPEVVLAGATSHAQDRLLADPRYGTVARPVGVLDRSRALALQRAADVLVVMAAGMPGRGSTSVATGKLFEYLAAKRPVLVLGEDTEAARIVSRAGAGVSAAEADPGSVADALEGLLDAPPAVDHDAVTAFAWPVLAERYERLIEEVCTEAAGPR
jgi:glycosyltransferase involved in cell wall biosynthesis